MLHFLHLPPPPLPLSLPCHSPFILTSLVVIGVVFIGTPLVNEGGSVELCAMKFGALTTQVIRVTIEIATTTDPAGEALYTDGVHYSRSHDGHVTGSPDTYPRRIIVCKFAISDRVNSIPVLISITPIHSRSHFNTVVDAVNFDPVLVFQPRTTRNCTRVTVPNDDVVSASAFLQFRLSSYESEGAKVMLAPRLLALTIFDNDGMLNLN